MQYPNLAGSLFPQHYHSRLGILPPEIWFLKSEQLDSTVGTKEKNLALYY